MPSLSFKQGFKGVSKESGFIEKKLKTQAGFWCQAFCDGAIRKVGGFSNWSLGIFSSPWLAAERQAVWRHLKNVQCRAKGFLCRSFSESSGELCVLVYDSCEKLTTTAGSFSLQKPVMIEFKNKSLSGG